MCQTKTRSENQGMKFCNLSSVSCPHIRPSMSSPAMSSPAISAFPPAQRAMNGKNVKHLPPPPWHLPLAENNHCGHQSSSRLWFRAIGLVSGVRIKIIKDRVSVCVRVVVMVTIWDMGGRFLRWWDGDFFGGVGRCPGDSRPILTERVRRQIVCLIIRYCSGVEQ